MLTGMNVRIMLDGLGAAIAAHLAHCMADGFASLIASSAMIADSRADTHVLLAEDQRGKIAGGVVGGVVGLLLLAAAALIVVRWRRRNVRPSDAAPDDRKADT